MAKQMPYRFRVSGKCCHHLMTCQHMMILAGSAQEKPKDLNGRGQKKAWDLHMDSIQRRTRTLQDLLQWGTSLLLTYAKEFGLYPESSTEPWKH